MCFSNRSYEKTELKSNIIDLVSSMHSFAHITWSLTVNGIICYAWKSATCSLFWSRFQPLWDTLLKLRSHYSITKYLFIFILSEWWQIIIKLHFWKLGICRKEWKWFSIIFERFFIVIMVKSKMISLKVAKGHCFPTMIITSFSCFMSTFIPITTRCTVILTLKDFARCQNWIL